MPYTERPACRWMFSPATARHRVLSSAVERLLYTERVGGSKPSAPTSRARRTRRSEEHTSELQSLMRISYAVFCLKKKKQKTITKYKTHQDKHQRHTSIRK